jgi:hypothetical protein
MEILKNDTNLNFVINTEQNFRTDLGWSENFMEFEKEVLEDIINPAKNYETVRYIHRPYPSTLLTNKEQTDIWFNFYFVSGSTYVQDYRAPNVDITLRENELMLRQSTESFFRLEFYKTPTVISNTGTTLTCEPPTRQNRRFVSAKNLSLPLGEKFLYTSTTSSFYIRIPIFTGSNYRNKENMYLFWFDDESNLEDTNLTGTITLDRYVFGTGSTVQTILFTNENNDITQVNIPTSGTTLIGWTGQTFTIPNQITYNRNFYHGMNTFFMTAKFFNGKDGSILDFTNQAFSTTHVVTEDDDMYYQVNFDHYERTYQMYKYSGVTGNTSPIRVGTGHTVSNSINFYEKGGIPPTPTPTPTITSTPTPTSTITPTPTNTNTPTPTPTSTTPIVYNYYQYDVVRSGIPNANGGFFTYIDVNGATQTILRNDYGYVGRYCMRENSYQNNQFNLYTFTQVGICGPNGDVTPDTGFTNANITIQPVISCSTNYDNTDGIVQFTNITKGIGSDVSAPYTVWMSGQTETGWTLVDSNISEGGDSSIISNLKSDNKPTTDYYAYDIKVVDTNGKTRILLGGVIFSCDTEPPITFTASTNCVDYEGTGTLTVDITGGGTGTGYFWKIISGPAGYPTGNQTDGGTVSNLVNGNYAILIGDSSGNKLSTNEVYIINCPPAPNVSIFANLVDSVSLPNSSQCSSGTGYTFELNSSIATFCNATTFSNNSLSTLPTKTYWICYDGQSRQVFHPSNASLLQQPNTCQTVT